MSDISSDFLSEVLAKSLSERGTDGYMGQYLDNHYVFPNIFAYFLGQVIFYLTDGILLLEKKLRSGESNAYISTIITDNEIKFSKKIKDTYAVYIPRYIIFKACMCIDYFFFFFNSLSKKHKENLTTIMCTV